MPRIGLIHRYKSSRGVRTGARCRGPFWGCDRVGVCKPAFSPVRRHLLLPGRIPARGAHCTAEEGPHVPWGSDPGSAHRFGFVAVRLRSAALCGCDPLAEGSLAGADAMRPASRISIAALCAPSRTGASRTGSGAHPRSAGPCAGLRRTLLCRTRAHLTAICASSEAIFATFYHLNAPSIVQHKRREQ